MGTRRVDNLDRRSRKGSPRPVSLLTDDAEERDLVIAGGLVRVGVKNTLQTHRGGPGRWYEVDWLTVDAAVVYSTNSATNRFPTPQYFAWEPGYSQLGNFVEGSYTWQFSDSLAFIGEGIWEETLEEASRGSHLKRNI